jgi:acyl carrier protein
MNENLKIYNSVFSEAFGIQDLKLDGLKYQDILEWDSVGHMGLMASLEEAFKIEMEIDDIIDFSSYQKGKEILLKYKNFISKKYLIFCFFLLLLPVSKKL